MLAGIVEFSVDQHRNGSSCLPICIRRPLRREGKRKDRAGTIIQLKERWSLWPHLFRKTSILHLTKASLYSLSFRDSRVEANKSVPGYWYTLVVVVP